MVVDVHKNECRPGLSCCSNPQGMNGSEFAKHEKMTVLKSFDPSPRANP